MKALNVRTVRFVAVNLGMWLLVGTIAFAASVSYTYDSLNRLRSVDYGNGSEITYTYDAAGNRLSYSGVVTNDATAPSVTITNPTSGSSFATSATTVNLSGTAMDNVAVTLVTWANDRGGIGTANGTTAWSINGIPLQTGTNFISVTAYNPDGSNSTAVLMVTQTPAPPHANFTTTPTQGARPLNVSFVDISTGTVTSRVWSFGDGGTSSAQDVSHPYTSSGVYSVSLSVFGPLGSDMSTRSNLITVTNDLPSFTSGPVASNALGTVGGTAVVKPGQTVGFSVGTYDANGNPLSCLWNFGDGGTSANCDPSYVFTNCGPHDVSVTVGDGFSSATTGMTVVVTCPMDVNSLKLQAKFKKVGTDTCAIKGTLTDLPADVSIANAVVMLDIGGATVDFQLNAKGGGANRSGSVKFSRNKKTGVWTFTGKLKGDLKGSWATYGITSGNVINSAVPTFPVLLMLQSETLETFDAEPTLTYNNRSGTSGTGTYVPVK